MLINILMIYNYILYIYIYKTLFTSTYPTELSDPGLFSLNLILGLVKQKQNVTLVKNTPDNRHKTTYLPCQWANSLVHNLQKCTMIY